MCLESLSHHYALPVIYSNAGMVKSAYFVISYYWWDYVNENKNVDRKISNLTTEDTQKLYIHFIINKTSLTLTFWE